MENLKYIKERFLDVNALLDSLEYWVEQDISVAKKRINEAKEIIKTVVVYDEKNI